MNKNEFEITLTVAKTIQEKQFEPLVISAQLKMVTTEEDLETDTDGGYQFLNDTIKAQFAERNIEW